MACVQGTFGYRSGTNEGSAASEQICCFAGEAAVVLSALQQALRDRLLRQAETITDSGPQAAGVGASAVPEGLGRDVAGRVAAQLDLGDLDPEQRRLFLERLAEHQRRFVQYAQRELSEQVAKIQSVYPYLCHEECVAAMNLISEERRELDDNIAVLGVEDEAVTRLADRGFELVVRQEVAFRYMKEASAAAASGCALAPGPPLDARAGGSGMRRKPSNRGTSRKSNSELMLEGVRIGRRQDGRLCLDEALRRMQQTGSFDGWSEARIKAWLNKDANPNAYYYRFNDPGEEQRNGKWTKQEHERFMQRLKECHIGENYEWGIFSMALPGRVGYQCSNYYRTLLKRGIVKDDNYYFNEKGEPKFRFKTKSGVQLTSDENGTSCAVSNAARVATKRSGQRRLAKRKQSLWDSDDSDSAADDDETEYVPNHAVSAQSVRRSARSRRIVNYADVEDGAPANAGGMEMHPDGTAAVGSGTNPKRSRRDTESGAPNNELRMISQVTASASDSGESSLRSSLKDSSTPSEYSDKAGALCELNGNEFRSRSHARDSDNPLPDFIDVITMEPIRRPAISPSGHVLGYLTWRRLLQQHPRNTCPFTKKPLRLADLTLLTHENIHEYTHRIVGR